MKVIKEQYIPHNALKETINLTHLLQLILSFTAVHSPYNGHKGATLDSKPHSCFVILTKTSDHRTVQFILFVTI